MKKPNSKEIEDFLESSNAIEGVYDLDSFRQAKIAWKYLMTQKVMTPGVILKTHKILMLHQNLESYYKGYFRTCDVMIGGRYGLACEKVPDAIKSWCEDVATSLKVPGKNGSNIKADHVEYEAIHPFADGNGRTGRMFMNWERLKVGLPLLIIHTGEEQYAYYEWFREKTT